MSRSSRLEWCLSRFQVKGWKGITQTIAVWKRAFLILLVPTSNPTNSSHAKRLARTLRRRNRRYFPLKNKENKSRRIPWTDWWASIPHLLPHFLPLEDCLVRCPNMWTTPVWKHKLNKCVSSWLETFDPSLIMGLLFFVLVPLQNSIDLSTTKIPSFKAFLSTLDNPKCFRLCSTDTIAVPSCRYA